METLSRQQNQIQKNFIILEKLLAPVSEKQERLHDQNKAVLLDGLEKSKAKPVKLDKSARHIPNNQGVIKGAPNTTFESQQFLEIDNEDYWEVNSINSDPKSIFKNQEDPLSFAKLELKNGIMQAFGPLDSQGGTLKSV